MNGARSAVEDHRPLDTDDRRGVADLLRQIIGQVGDGAAASVTPPDTPGAQAVLLDVQVDGARYTLLRLAPELPQSQVSLSPREREIVRLVARGLPNKAIAAVLDISLWTVATYIRRLFAKLGVGSRAEMVAKVLNDGLLGAD